MLKLAYAYQEKLSKAWQAIVFDKKYQFYNFGAYWEYSIKVDDGSWERMQMVSVDKNDNVIGLLSATCDRFSNKISSIGAINFGEMNITFSKDMYAFLSSLFDRFSFRKIEWTVIVGNPAEKMYDKIIERYGGRVAGIHYESTLVFDGTLHDVKEYELFKRDYDLRKRNLRTEVMP